MSQRIRLMTLAPGHFHAALVLKEFLPEVHPRLYVYAPLDGDTAAYVERIAAFNARATHPTNWELDLRTGTGFLERYLREQPGNAVVIAGRNRTKIDHILAAARNGCHILADKPWVIRADDYPKVEAAFREADLRENCLADMMTERHEITNVLHRELIRDPELFGDLCPGTPDQPALELASTHYLRKVVSGVPLRRPPWYFDPIESGISISDVGVHLVDLALWMLFPEGIADPRADLKVLGAKSWPLKLNLARFAALTGCDAWPEEAGLPMDGDTLLYEGNGSALFTARGVHVRYTCLWEYEAPPGGCDRHEGLARGTVADIAVRTEAGPDGHTRPEVYVVPKGYAKRADVGRALAERLRQWQTRYPGLKAEDRGAEFRLDIPDRFRHHHEEHFAEVLDGFLRQIRNPRGALDDERAAALARYWVATQASTKAGY